MPNDFSHIQTDFFKQAKQKIGSTTLPANEIASLLKISRSEAYNKISGKSQLTLNQLYTLCKKYNIRFEIPNKQQLNSCNISYTPFHSGNISISDYIKSLNVFIEEMASKQIINLSCATDDIPFFHLFKYPELTAFKMHFWDNRILKYGENNAEKCFDFKKYNKKDIKVAYQLYNNYQNIPSTEIWTKSYLLITPDQIKYAQESQLIKDSGLGKIICDQLLSTLTDVEKYAVKRTKKNDVPFEWYQCDVVGSVTYLVETLEGKNCFLRFNTFNNFQTTDDKVCKEVQMWLNSLLNNSTGFSGHGSRQRNIYLQNARKTIEDLRDSF